MEVKVIGSGGMLNECNSSSFIIDGNTAIDMPNGFCKALYRMNLDPVSIENVLITHLHGDHYFDIPFYIIAKNKFFDKKVKMYVPKGADKKIKKLIELAHFSIALDFFKKKTKLQLITDLNFKINSYKVERVLLSHSKQMKSFGFLFDSGSTVVGFSGDTAMCDNLDYMLGKCSYIFIDCALVNGNAKHLGIDNITDLSTKYPNCKFALTHLSTESRKELQKIKIDNVTILNDGDVINI